MTKDKKELLLKDLCVRFPYGVKIKRSNCPINLSVTGILGEYVHHTPYYVGRNIEINSTKIDEVKPYLRLMSSMTEEEIQEAEEINRLKYVDGKFANLRHFTLTNDSFVDWLYSHHFDYRGLIEKGLALEAPDDMYKIK